MKFLFLFTITPVQDFISQSRKLKDLFGSSEILSQMSEIGLKIAKREGAKEIFPILQEDKDGSYPNRFLVKFENKSSDEIKQIAKEIEENLLKFLRRLNDKNHSLIKKHITEYFTFYWAISEIKSNDYRKAFDEVEKALAGAKNTRFFTQLGSGNGERGRKCSICGERNVVVYNGKLPMLKEQVENDKPIKDNIAHKSEGLCGVCYIKRRYTKYDKFESTADIALANIFNKLDKNEYYKSLKKDAQLFYEENLRESYFESQGYDKNKLQKYKQEFQKFKNDLKQHKLKQTSYYAVIMFDGDNMGEWLSGKYIQNDNLQEFHKFLSRKLLKFASEVKKIDNLETVYAGGEDFLGFVNINYLLEILQILRQKWDKIVNESLKNEFNLTKNFTFSAGVAIAHYKSPLNNILNTVRSAEKKAKDAGRDRVCFTILKRSGDYREATILYDKLKHLSEILPILKNDFSDKFITTLEKEFSLFDVDSYMVESEVKRLLNRAKLHENAKVFDMQKNIDELYDGSFEEFINALHFLRFLKKET